MKKVLTNVCAICSIEAVNVTDGKAELSESQLDKIEDHIAQLSEKIASKDKEIDSQKTEIKNLKTEIETLKKEPAAESSSVTENQKTPKADNEESAAHDFLKVNASAAKLFNSLP